MNARAILTILAAALGVMTSSACRAAPAPHSAEIVEAPKPAATWHEAVSERGGYTVRWRSEPATIPNNEPFELDLLLYAGEGTEHPLSDAEVYVHAVMPHHRHGMLRRPVATVQPDGSYRVRGMLFHMGGSWQLLVDVVRDGELESTRFELEIP